MFDKIDSFVSVISNFIQNNDKVFKLDYTKWKIHLDDTPILPHHLINKTKVYYPMACIYQGSILPSVNQEVVRKIKLLIFNNWTAQNNELDESTLKEIKDMKGIFIVCYYEKTFLDSDDLHLGEVK